MDITKTVRQQSGKTRDGEAKRPVAALAVPGNVPREETRDQT